MSNIKNAKQKFLGAALVGLFLFGTVAGVMNNQIYITVACIFGLGYLLGLTQKVKAEQKRASVLTP